MSALCYLWFVIGALLTLKGADWLTDGSTAVALRLRVSTLVVGLTVVAFGTSAPELVVSCVSAAHGQSEMAIGNVVGSNIFNLLAIMGVTALVRPVACSAGNIRFDVPICMVAGVVVCALAANDLHRGDGVVLLCLLILFILYTVRIARRGQPATAATPTAHAYSVGGTVARIVVGLICLVIGGELFVRGATGIALSWGVSQSVIALTIVAAGTSLPELVTSAMAAAKGDTDMALGNVVGSCVMNLLLVLGAAACIAPLPPGDIGLVDTGTMLGATAIVWLFCRYGDGAARRINRVEGAVLVLGSIIYYAFVANG